MLEIVLCGVFAFRPTDEEGLDIGFTWSPTRQRIAVWREDVPDAERWRDPSWES